MHHGPRVVWQFSYEDVGLLASLSGVLTCALLGIGCDLVADTGVLLRGINVA